MKNFYETQIAESKLKQQLMELGLRAQMQSSGSTLQLSYVNRCINLINGERTYQESCKKALQDEISGEAEKKRQSKKALGIGG